MFTFFKKAQESIEQQIFNDVYSAEGLILEEAKRVLANPPQFTKEQEVRLEQLKQLGFDNFDEVKKLEKAKEDFQLHSGLKRMIRYYNFAYPFNRFISQESVQIIIKKYKLVLAKASDYIAEIPEKNQKEIVKFKVMRKDVRKPDEIREGWGIMSFPSYIGFFDIGMGSVNYYESLNKLKFGQLMNQPEFDDYRRLEKERLKRIASEKKAKDRERIPGKDLLIVAPQHKLNMKGREIKDGILRIKDPIVLQPVHMGYLIVSSWGLEASDELVVNKIEN